MVVADVKLTKGEELTFDSQGELKEEKKVEKLA